MIPIERDNLRDAVIAASIGLMLAWAMSGCAANQLPPPSPTAAQLASAPQPTPPAAPRVTGATILAQQPPEVQQAIQEGPPWPSFKWPRERLVPYTDHMTPLTIDVAPFEDVDISLHEGERIDGVSLGDAGLSVWLTASSAWAVGAGGALPWDAPLTTVTTDMTGPVASGVTIAGVVLTGLAWAHSEHGSGIRKASAVGFGGAAALGATQLMAAVFPFATALL